MEHHPLYRTRNQRGAIASWREVRSRSGRNQSGLNHDTRFRIDFTILAAVFVLAQIVGIHISRRLTVRPCEYFIPARPNATQREVAARIGLRDVIEGLSFPQTRLRNQHELRACRRTVTLDHVPLDGS